MYCKQTLISVTKNQCFGTSVPFLQAIEEMLIKYYQMGAFGSDLINGFHGGLNLKKDRFSENAGVNQRIDMDL